MRKKCFKYEVLVSVMAFSLGAQGKPSQEIPAIDPQVTTYYAITQQDMSYQERHYRIYVAVPKAKAKSYAVLYTLDGNAQFPMVLNQSLKHPTQLPLIVGVGYPIKQAYPTQERTLDYTPKVAGEPFAKGGGAEPFYRFLVQEVKPWVQTHYPVDLSHQTLFGHSFGGVFTLMVYQNHPDTFTNYVAASPALWWGKSTMVDVAKMQKAKAGLTITVGELEEHPDYAHMSEERKKIMQTRQGGMTARQLCDQLPACQFILIKGKTHGGSIPQALDTALSQTKTGDN